MKFKSCLDLTKTLFIHSSINEVIENYIYKMFNVENLKIILIDKIDYNSINIFRIKYDINILYSNDDNTTGTEVLLYRRLFTDSFFFEVGSEKSKIGLGLPAQTEYKPILKIDYNKSQTLIEISDINLSKYIFNNIYNILFRRNTNVNKIKKIFITLHVINKNETVEEEK